MGAFWISKDANFLPADNEYTDRIVQISEGTFSHIPLTSAYVPIASGFELDVITWLL